MERNWFAEDVVPQMRVILACYYGNPAIGFRALAARGWFDNAVEEWHAAPQGSSVGQAPLHAHLGLTWAEYRAIFSPDYGELTG